MTHTHTYKTELIVSQYYTVIIDETGIEKARAKITWVNYPPENIEERYSRLHRMFQAIIADPKALYAIVEYQVICEHQDNNDDGTGGFLEAHYGTYLSFPEVLATRAASCFTQDDRAWLQDIAASHAQPRGEYDGEPEDLEELAECFKVNSSGWNIEPHSH